MDTANILNTLGVVLILTAFLLLTLKKVTHIDTSYNVINLCGSSLAAAGAYMLDATPFFVLNVGWILVALYALLVKARK